MKLPDDTKFPADTGYPAPKTGKGSFRKKLAEMRDMQQTTKGMAVGSMVAKTKPPQASL